MKWSGRLVRRPQYSQELPSTQSQELTALPGSLYTFPILLTFYSFTPDFSSLSLSSSSTFCTGPTTLASSAASTGTTTRSPAMSSRRCWTQYPAGVCWVKFEWDQLQEPQSFERNNKWRDFDSFKSVNLQQSDEIFNTQCLPPQLHYSNQPTSIHVMKGTIVY